MQVLTEARSRRGKDGEDERDWHLPQRPLRTLRFKSNSINATG